MEHKEHYIQHFVTFGKDLNAILQENSHVVIKIVELSKESFLPIFKREKNCMIHLVWHSHTSLSLFLGKSTWGERSRKEENF